MRGAMLLVVTMLVGCTKDDGDKLARIGRLTAAHVQDAAPERTPWGEMPTTPADRVRLRLKHDANLSGHAITVVDDGDGVRLRGTVSAPHQSDWAERLARETTGVNRVVNEITLTP